MKFPSNFGTSMTISQKYLDLIAGIADIVQTFLVEKPIHVETVWQVVKTEGAAGRIEASQPKPIMSTKPRKKILGEVNVLEIEPGMAPTALMYSRVAR